MTGLSFQSAVFSLCDSFGRGLTFSSLSFTAGTNLDNFSFGSGSVTFAGDLTGYVFPPLGCETQAAGIRQPVLRCLTLSSAAVALEQSLTSVGWHFRMGRN